MEISLLWLMLALIVGFVLAWWFKPSAKSQEAAVLGERVLNMEKQLQQAGLQIQGLQEALIEANKENAANAAIATERLSDLQRSKQQLQDVFNAQQETKQILATRIAELEVARKQMDELNARIIELNRTQLLEFEKAANKILEEKTKVFSTTQDEQLKKMLDPFSKDMESFKKKVDEVYQAEAKERHSLGDRVKELMDLNKQLSEDAHSLTAALKGDNKIQGNWGEMILESILEMSGLSEGREYHKQNTVHNEEGSDLRPDIIVTYPDGRKIVIDSKVSLTAYEKYVAAASKEDQDKSLSDHAASVKNHVNTLGKKDYAKHADALDYVLMFVPIEPAWLLAMKQDPQLWNVAYKQKILLVSPTNLLAVLKIIADLWKVEKQNRNAIDIAEKAGALYDKFADVVKDFMDVGKSLIAAKESHSQGMKRLAGGHGDVLKKVEELKEMGAKAKAKKSLPTIEEMNQVINN